MAMREYDVAVCSPDCGRYIASTPSLDAMWTLAQTGRLENTQGDDPSYCSNCDTKIGIDERGPWRERMVPESALEWLADMLEAAGGPPARDMVAAAMKAAKEDGDSDDRSNCD